MHDQAFRDGQAAWRKKNCPFTSIILSLNVLLSLTTDKIARMKPVLAQVQNEHMFFFFVHDEAIYGNDGKRQAEPQIRDAVDSQRICAKQCNKANPGHASTHRFESQFT
jgi:ABC-type microcin C transport system permease subunit YejE